MLKVVILFILFTSTNLFANESACYNTDKLELLAKKLIKNFDKNEFVSSYHQMLALPEGYSRYVYSELSEVTQKRIWQYHTDQFAQNESLTQRQTKYIKNYKEFINYLFDGKNASEQDKKLIINDNDRMLAEKIKAERILGKALSFKLINDLSAYYEAHKIKQCHPAN